MLIDTLTIAQNLTSAGIPDAHAKAIAKEYAHLMQHQIDQFATKEDIKSLQTDLKHVEECLQTDLTHLENRLDTKIDTKFTELDNKIDTKFNFLDNKIDSFVWRITVNLWGVTATVAGLLFAALRLF